MEPDPDRGMFTSREQEEGVIRDVLQELDRERKRRAELEAQVRVLTEDRALQLQCEEHHSSVAKREFVALETERDELLTLVEALTSDNEAISAASKSSSKGLPLHVVRLLEVMPWDERARQLTVATDEVFEWQVYDEKSEKWSSQLRQFPPFFRTMPIVKPHQGDIMDETLSSNEWLGRNRSRRIFGGESPPKGCVMTDASTTHVLNVNDGFPLPENGFWRWIGGWRVDKRVVAPQKHQDRAKNKVDCDDDGWSYAQDPRHFESNPAELCWDSQFETGEISIVRRTVRRRKWTRRRALVSYPFASERTTEYLKSVAENAVLEVTTSKLNDQLIETKVQLTQCEEKLIHHAEIKGKAERLAAENAKLIAESSKEKGLAKSLKRLDSGLSDSDEGESRSVRHVDRIRNAFSSFVSSDAGDRARLKSDDTVDSDEDESSASSHSQKENGSDSETFDWKRFGRRGVFEQVKRSPVVKSIPGWRSPSPSEGKANPEDDDGNLLMPSLRT